MVIAANIPADLMPYLDSIFVKSLSTTINKLVSFFRENDIKINVSGQKIESPKKHLVGISSENNDYINANKAVSKSFTIVCIIATAKDLDIKLFD